MHPEPNSFFDPMDGDSAPPERSNDSNVASVEADVRVALEQRALIGTTGSISDLLGDTGTRSVAYWVEAAEELHSHAEHHEAIDCWKKALGVETPEHKVNREAMGDELWYASAFGEDEFLADEAAIAYAAAGLWQAAAHIRLKLGESAEYVLNMLRVALEKDAYLAWDDAWSLGSLGGLAFKSITSLETLAQFQAKLEQFHQASTNLIMAEAQRPQQKQAGGEPPPGPAITVVVIDGKRVFQIKRLAHPEAPPLG